MPTQQLMSGRDIRMVASDAARLRDDPALQHILDDLEKHATLVALHDFEPATRERGRQLCVAIHALRTEIQDRIDTVLLAEHNRQRQLASE